MRFSRSFIPPTSIGTFSVHPPARSHINMADVDLSKPFVEKDPWLPDRAFYTEPDPRHHIFIVGDSINWDMNDDGTSTMTIYRADGGIEKIIRTDDALADILGRGVLEATGLAPKKNLS